MLREYEAIEQRRMDDRAWGPVYLPMSLRPANPRYADREQFLFQLGEQFQSQLALRGLHCTRLTDEEATEIIAEGMTPPSAERLARRIQALSDARKISADIAAQLLDRNSAAEPCRAGMIWFVLTEPPLKSESGVGSLLRNWGGEALYRHHDRDPVTGPILRSIGTPRIVEAYIPARDFRRHDFFYETMIQQYLATRGLDVRGKDTESRTEGPVPANKITRILTSADLEFASLTEFEKWRELIT